MLIDNAQELARFCAEIAGAPFCALDTEFTWTQTYLPIPSLVQVAIPGKAAAIDVMRLADSALDPLRELASAPEIIKVIHALDQDVPLLKELLGVEPGPVFDTQIGAAFAGLGAQISYAALVREFLGIEIDKTEQRADWTQRPLPAQTLNYAVDDVRHLAELFPLLKQKLEATGRYAWACEDSASLAQRSLCRNYGLELEDAWRGVRGAGRLSPEGRVVLQALAAWREEQAREQNLRPARVIPDALLVRFCKYGKLRPADFRGVLGSQARRVRRILPELKSEAAAARAAFRAGKITAPKFKTAGKNGRDRRSPQYKTAVATAMTTLAKIARELALPKEVLAPRSQVEAFVYTYLETPADTKRFPLLQGWRRDVVGNVLLQCLDRLNG